MLTAGLSLLTSASALADDAASVLPAVVSTDGLRGKVMCGYQGWFRASGDGSNEGWVHWSRDARRIAPETLTFEMWPDMARYGADERFAAPGFTLPDGTQAELFSSMRAATVRRHFEWMRDCGLDGVWLQHFVVDLPGGPLATRYASRRKVLEHVRAAAQATGRVWALTYDVAGMPAERIFDVLTADWKKLVDEKMIDDPLYLHDEGRPVVQIFGYYRRGHGATLSADVGRRLIEFFHAAGPYRAYLVGGGDWDWRSNSDDAWQQCYRRFDAYVPWNVGNYSADAEGTHASMGYWADDRAACRQNGVLWIPTVYPGFSWDNLQQKPAGSTAIPRRGGRFYWEQFHELARSQVDTVFVAMFDELDEGTAILPVTSQPPTEAHFATFEGLPSDWYLRLTGEGIRMLRGVRPLSEQIPIKP